jgi:hypothetical protein
MLKDGSVFHDLGPKYFDQRDETTVVNRLRKRLNDLGYAVDLRKAA